MDMHKQRSRQVIHYLWNRQREVKERVERVGDITAREAGQRTSQLTNEHI